MKLKISYISMLYFSLCGQAFSSENKDEKIDLNQVIPNYRESLAALPVDYTLLEKKQLAGVILQKYKLSSQSWTLQGSVSPGLWQHEVDIYIPDSAHDKNALVVINSGSNDDGSGNPVAPTNFAQEQLSQIATETKTIVISVSNVPNQKLTYQGATKPLAEDDSVAWSWKLFIDDTKKYQNSSLHIPMSAAVSQALRLAKSELHSHNISKFIVTGASKRGWATWLAALSDPNVVAVVPFAMDLLSTQESLRHMYHSYGDNWPVAFNPYYQQGIDKQIDTNEFSSLMTIEDPLSYLSTDMRKRLEIEKYIINASGDDFYVPDNSRFYYDILPGPKSLRVVGNSTHHGILSVTVPSLITFLNRYQAQKALPEISEVIGSDDNKNKTLKVSFSEQPSQVLQWTAHNPVARDFRFACGVKYHSSQVTLPDDGKETVIPLTKPDSGWQSTFIEATFSDGYVATSQVYITPDEYPKIAPPSKGRTCQTLPGRGLTPKYQ
ncbi:PhoPQ-activated pathogenicity-related family protein [Klebsiella sp. BIGb0407]|uniref:PhoPQ-activated pathogenicity-related family protein n=1 Tax=Klebsiella sp. BIGb0407 TaxID=2940603 RepID=UPI0021695B29|nr:PhoPQ-activated protein PqaA family protein [Klebsiella sp. BIGb0407]MCS3429931.1 PhoPQ-activated pathogenicity-related protein [Klebsiella sp. BIGb0407]